MKHVRIYRPENGRLDIRHKHLFIGANSAVGFESEVVFVPGAPDPVVSNAYEKAIEDFPGETIDYLHSVEETNYRQPALYELQTGGTPAEGYKAVVFYGNEAETNWFGLFMKLFQTAGDWVPVTDFTGEITARVVVTNRSGDILQTENQTFDFSEGLGFGKRSDYVELSGAFQYHVENIGQVANYVEIESGEPGSETPIQDVHVMIIK